MNPHFFTAPFSCLKVVTVDLNAIADLCFAALLYFYVPHHHFSFLIQARRSNVIRPAG